jgi:ATP synthase subunit delta 2
MNKIIHAKLICTSSFTDAEKQEADNILKEKYADYKVILTQEIDDTLLGGYVLKIGNHEYDKSYKERLRQLQEKITGR